MKPLINFLGFVLGIILVVTGTWQTLKMAADYPLNHTLIAYWTVIVILAWFVEYKRGHRLEHAPFSLKDEGDRKYFRWNRWRSDFVEKKAYQLMLILLIVAWASWLINHFWLPICSLVYQILPG